MRIDEARIGLVWDAIAGRVLPPPAAQTLGWRLEATLEPDQFAPTLELKVNFVRSAGRGRSSVSHVSFIVAARSRSSPASCTTARVSSSPPRVRPPGSFE